MNCNDWVQLNWPRCNRPTNHYLSSGGSCLVLLIVKQIMQKSFMSKYCLYFVLKFVPCVLLGGGEVPEDDQTTQMCRHTQTNKTCRTIKPADTQRDFILSLIQNAIIKFFFPTYFMIISSRIDWYEWATVAMSHSFRPGFQRSRTEDHKISLLPNQKILV